MSAIAIHAEGLSKKFKVGRIQESYKTLRDTIAESFTAPFHSLLGRRSSTGGAQRSVQDSTDEMWALEDVSFDVAPGEVVGVIGRNGAGKSTLLKILSRITEPTRGFAEVRGRVGSMLEVGSGFHQELTGRENVYLNGAILGMRKAEIDRNFERIVDFSGVNKFIDTPVKHYSSGMYLRLAFAVAAHLEPEILLVDEVLAVGDLEFQKKCLGKMGDVAREGRTVLFVSHNLGAIKELCQSGLVLEGGKVDYRGPVVNALVHYTRLLTSRMDEHRPLTSSGWNQVWIEGQDTESPEPIESASGFTASAILELGSSLQRVRLYCLVDDADGECLAHNFLDWRKQESTEPGRYRVHATFPPLWLVPNAYSLYFKLIGTTLDGRTERFLSNRVVLDITERSGQMDGKVKARLVPQVRWQVDAG